MLGRHQIVLSLHIITVYSTRRHSGRLDRCEENKCKNSSVFRADILSTLIFIIITSPDYLIYVQICFCSSNAYIVQIQIIFII